MVLLHAKSFKYVAADGDLGAAGALTLIEGQNAVVKSTAKVIDHILSTNPNPAERVIVGRSYEMTAVLAAASEADFEAYFGGAEDGGTYEEDQTIQSLELYDVQLAVQTTTNATSRTMTLTDVFFSPEWEMSFKQGERFYMPIKVTGSNATTLTIA